MYTESDSKVGFWLRWLCSTFFVFVRALCSHNGRSLQTKKLRSRLAKTSTCESLSVYVYLVDLLHNPASVDFWVLLNRFSIFFCGGCINFRILPPQKKSKIGQNNPKNRRSLSYARGLVLLLLFSHSMMEAKSRKSEIATPLKSLYSTLDPLSVTEHLAFYELYPETKEGQNALKRAWQLLSLEKLEAEKTNLILPAFDIQSIISLITRDTADTKVKLTSEQLGLIEKISSRLHNRSLKGHSVWTREEVLALSPEEIDLSRGLLLFQFDEAQETQEDIKHYEAILDIMSLQIAARLPLHPTDEEKIEAINHFIFHEMRFRFPPHSLYAKDIDLYTFLPSVLDNRQGVCLGVSILYLCIAQRLDLPLEIITPPGHIYIRYAQNGKLINIETTARGINPPSEIYLGINTRHLQQRTIKEVIGLSFMNQASVFWSKEDYETTTKLYEKAMPFLTSDPLLKMLLGYNYLFLGKKKEGVQLLTEIKNITFDEAVSRESIPEDYLQGKIDEEGIKAVFLPVDETRESIVEKQKELQKILKRYPFYRAGLMHLATTYLQLGRGNEAKEILERYHKIDPHNATIEYYLCILSLERLDYNRAWGYLTKTERLVYERSHYPKALEALRTHLRRVCPEPI